MRIVDEANSERAFGAVGEVLISAPQLSTGYLENAEETAETFKTDANGRVWLSTGDLGYLDQDGYLFIVDRTKDLIKTSGYQVWPREIEEVIASHPAVAEVAVAGVLHPEKGEVPHAWVVLRPGCRATEEEIRAYCRVRLTPYKIPARVEFRTGLPLTAAGKVLKRMLVTPQPQDSEIMTDDLSER